MIGEYKSFLKTIFEEMKHAGFNDAEFSELDHIAYRTETNERYRELKKKFLEISNAHDEVTISGRLITVFRLKNSIAYGDWVVHGLELCAPKENNKYKEGLEHAEFVTKASLEEFMNQHKSIKFNMKAFEKEINRELVIDFEGCAVKFHEQSLLKIRNL